VKGGAVVMSGDVQKVIELIDALSPDEKKVVYKKITDEINAKSLGFLDIINERAEKAPISMEEITKEVEAVRSVSYEKA
jgi:hypothetical protein